MAVVPPSGSACAFVLCCSFLVLIRFSVAHRELPDYFTDFDGGECEFEPGRGRIIRARDSERRGARFLNSVTSEAQSVCFQSCCETTSCDLAVYRRPTANGKHNCFLFFCDTPSLCVFAGHPGYTSSERRLKKTDLLPVTDLATSHVITSSRPTANTEADTPSQKPQTWESNTTIPSTGTTEVQAPINQASVNDENEPTSHRPHPLTKSLSTSQVPLTTDPLEIDFERKEKKGDSSNVTIGVIVVLLCLLLALAVPVVIIWRRKRFRFGLNVKGYYSHDDYLINGMYA